MMLKISSKFKDKKLIFIFFFILFNIISVLLVSIFQIYERFIDLNASILNGVNRAVDNGIKLSDLRGSLRDIADSYLDGEIMATSHLYSQINKVEIIKYNHDKCDYKHALLSRNINFNTSAYITKDINYSFYFCFSNNFYSETLNGKKLIATWITGFPIKMSSISSYLSHIISLSLIILIASIIILYKILVKQEEYKRKQLTQDIASKLKHEINRPISKIQTLSTLLFSCYEKYSEKNIKDKLNQILLLTKTHDLFLNAMFKYALNKNNIVSKLENNYISLNEIIDSCIDETIKDNVPSYIINKNISQFFSEHMIFIDKSYLAIAIQNILTNARQAVYRNCESMNKKFEKLEIDFKADYDQSIKSVVILIKNFGSYIERENMKEVFISGKTSNEKTNTGYGLPVLKDIVEMYKGEIELTSNKDSKDIKNSWVCFKIILKEINYIKNSSTNEVKHNESLIEEVLNKPAQLLTVAIIDDEFHLYKDWELINPNVRFLYFSHYDHFFDELDDNKNISISEINIIITDFYFDKIQYGLTLLSSNNLESLRNVYRYNGIIALSSNVEQDNLINKHIDIVINKYPQRIENLINRV